MAPKEWNTVSQANNRGSPTSDESYSHSHSHSQPSTIDKSTPSSNTSNNSSSTVGVNKNNAGNKRVMKRNRVSYVCYACRRRKTRCDRGNPCSKCVALSTECVYSISEMNNGNKVSATQVLAETSGTALPNSTADIVATAISDPALSNLLPLQQLSAMLPHFQQQSKSIKPPMGSAVPLQPPEVDISSSTVHADAMRIVKLEEEVAFWKNKANSMVPPGALNSLPRSYTDAPVDSPHSSAFTESSLSNPARIPFYPHSIDNAANGKGFGQIRISLEDSEKTFFIHEQLRALHPPFGFISLVFRDPHLTCSFASIYGFTYTKIIEFVGDKDDITIQNVMKFGGSSLISGEHSLIYYCDPGMIKHLQWARKQNVLKAVPTVVFTKGDRLEDFIKSEYPPVLQTLLSDILETLPPTGAGITFYLFQFLKSIYPFYPYLDVEPFLESIYRMISYEDATGAPTGKARWNLSKDNLRNDLENLAIFMVILQISHDFLTVSLNEDVKMDCIALGLHKLDFTYDKWLSLSQRILTLLNVDRFYSEDIFCCMLYQRICCSFSPRESNLLLDQHLLLHSGQLLQTALVLGLHKDPTDYKLMFNPSLIPQRVINYRRKLWLGLCNSIFQETLPLGFTAKIEQYHDYFFKNLDYTSFMESVRNSMTSSGKFDYQLINLAIKKYQLGLLMAKINKACTDFVPAAVSEILFMISKLEAEVLKFESLKDYPGDTQATIKLPSTTCTMDIAEVLRCEIVIMKLATSSLIHNVLWSLYLKVEVKLKSEENATFYRLHSTLFEMMVFNCFKFYSFLSDLMFNKYEKDTAQFRYVLAKHIQQSYLRVSLCFLSILLKLALVEKDLEMTERHAASTVVENINAPTVSVSKLQLVKELYDLTEKCFISLATQSTKYDLLKTSLFYNKTQCLFAYFIQILQMDRILDVSTRFWDFKLCNKPIPQKVVTSIARKWGLDVEHAETIRTNFYLHSSLHLIDADVWIHLQKRLVKLNLPSANLSSNAFEKDPLYSAASSVDAPMDLNLDLSNFFDLDANLGFPSFSF